MEFAFDGDDDSFNLPVADRPFPAGFLQTLPKLMPVERGARAVFLDDFDRAFFAAFEGGVLPAAGETLAMPANRKAAFADFRFDDAICIVMAEGTLYRVVHTLVGVVTPLARQALAATANRIAVLTRPRVNHLVVVDAANGALHKTLMAEVTARSPLLTAVLE
jgi:hypothetical protein